MTQVIENKEQLKAYHIEFTAVMKQPGTIMLVSKDEEAAKELLMKMLAHMQSVEIQGVYDIEEIPALKLLKEAQEKAREEQMTSTETEEETKEPTYN